MGKWLAEFQENTLEMPIPSTAITDISCDTSVLSVQTQGHLGGKTEMLIEAACRGLEITPAQFTAICSKEDLEDISNGKIPLWELQVFARCFADGIDTGRIVFHPKTQELIRHLTACQWYE